MSSWPSNSDPNAPYGYGQSGYEPAPQQQPSSYQPGYQQPSYQQPTYAGAGQNQYEQGGYAQYEQPSYGSMAPQHMGGFTPYLGTPAAPPRPSVSFMEAIKLGLKNWKNFSGRASRSEFWWWTLGTGIVAFVLAFAFGIVMMVAAGIGGSSSDAAISIAAVVGWLVVMAFSLVIFVPSLSLTVRRLHDAGQSGWMYLISMVPYVGGFILLIMTAQASNPAGARYDDPNQPLFGPEHL